MNGWRPFAEQPSHANGDAPAHKLADLTAESDLIFGNLEQHRIASGLNGKCDAIEAKYYAQWQGHGVHLPSPPPELRDWFSTFSLAKDEDYLIDPQVGTVCMGLGWDTKADIDGSAILFDSALRVVDVVWFKKLESECKSVTHSGDNVTGEGDGDVEVVTVDLDQVPLGVHHIVFAVCVYTYNLLFDQVDGAYVRMMRGKAKYRQHVMCKFSLTDMSGNAMLLGQMSRRGGYWNFRALGTPASGRSVQELLKVPANFTCLRNSSSYDPVFRHITVQVLKGTDLAAKDPSGLFRRQASSDPYYIVSYKKKTFASVRRDRTLNPEWNDPPFVLGAVMEAERKAVKIFVFDYNALWADDFMGVVRIPARALFNAGIGEHRLSFPLGPSKKKQFKDEDVSGDIHIIVTVSETP